MNRSSECVFSSYWRRIGGGETIWCFFPFRYYFHFRFFFCLVDDVPETVLCLHAPHHHKHHRDFFVISSFFCRYDVLIGVTRAEAYFAFNFEDVQYGIEADRRSKILRTYVRNTYRYHLNEILATIVNEYTDWERPIQHPINIRWVHSATACIYNDLKSSRTILNTLFNSLLFFLFRIIFFRFRSSELTETRRWKRWAMHKLLRQLPKQSICIQPTIGNRFSMYSTIKRNSVIFRRYVRILFKCTHTCYCSEFTEVYAHMLHKGLIWNSVWFIRFHLSSPNQRQGCIHGEDLPYIFGAPLVGGFNHFPRNYTKSEISLSESVMLYWSNFIRTGYVFVLFMGNDAC